MECGPLGTGLRDAGGPSTQAKTFNSAALSTPCRRSLAKLPKISTYKGAAPSSTSQFDLVINNVGRLRGRQRQPCKHRDIARGFGLFQGNLCRASRGTYGYVPRQPEHTGLCG